MTYAEFADEYLEPETAEKFKVNCKKRRALDRKIKSVKTAIGAVFVWDNTPEGRAFWEAVDKAHREAIDKAGSK